MYIPWIAQHIVKVQTSNEEGEPFYPGASDLIPINLKGVAIGNGVIDEVTNSPWFYSILLYIYPIIDPYAIV